ncbi:MAG: hypothetical protein ACRD27_01170, partial [Terracidiphilus sp.]
VLNRVSLATADPAFQASLKAVEKHIEEQSRFATWRHGKRGLFSSEDAPPAEEHVEPAAPVKSAPPPAARAARAEAEPAVRFEAEPPAAAAAPPATPVFEEKNPVPDRAPAPPRTPARPRTEETSEPMPMEEAEMPWWLAEAPAEQAALAPVEKRIEPEAPAVEVKVRQGAEPRAVETSAPRLVNKREAEPEAPREAVRQTPREPEPAEPELDEPAYDAASRLSGLRNLLFTLGLKDQGRTRQTDEEQAEELPVERVAERPAVFRTLAPPPEPVRVSASRGQRTDAPARLVTTEPEFLPPKKPAKARQENDDYEEIGTLPSRRGQYKR